MNPGGLMNLEHLSRALRSLLREKGWSQKAFAEALGVSLPTAKRWLKGEGIALADWLRSLEAAGISWAELLERAGGISSDQFSYTLAQEEALSRTPGLLAYFDLLLGGDSPTSIARTHGLSKAQTAELLGQLARQKLIDWLPKDRVRLLVKGEPRWNAAGPLAKKFRRQTLREFTEQFGEDAERMRIGLYELSEESLTVIPSLLTEVLEKLRQRELRDARGAARRKKACVILGSAAFTPSIFRLPTRSR